VRGDARQRCARGERFGGDVEQTGDEQDERHRSE
jgi:hypothetical protein